MITIDDLTPAQNDALRDLRVPRPQSEDFGKAYLSSSVHPLTRKALVSKELVLPDLSLTPNGAMLHQSICARAGLPDAFDKMHELLVEKHREKAIANHKAVRLKAVAENFRGLMVDPIGDSNAESKADLADEIIRYMGSRFGSTTVPLTLAHLEAIASRVRLSQLAPELEVD